MRRSRRELDRVRQRHFWRGKCSVVPLLALSAALVGRQGAAAAEPPPTIDSATETPPAIFAEQAASAGLHFVHFNGMSGEYYYSEMMGSGVGLVDYDDDGDLDVYLIQCQMLNQDKSPSEATFPPSPEMLPLQDRLYRNDSTVQPDGVHRLEFTDVTGSSGIDAAGYGMGVATGDFDNDGFTDLYVTAAGPNHLFRNHGDGIFTDATTDSRTGDSRWGASATFIDFDRDGWLDLYLVNYVDFTVASHKLCRSLTGAPDYCGPLAFRPVEDRLLRNRRDGTFEDVSGSSRVDRTAAAGLGVVSGDFDADGWPDLYVANDGMPNLLWMNQRDGTFSDLALAGGSALSMEGQAEAGMGVIAGDFDGDGDEDLLVTHLTRETNTLYRNDGFGVFEDLSNASALGSPSWPYTGFGAAWIDYDNDGWLDLVTVNGAVKVIEERAAADDPYPLGMPNQLFRNLEGRAFEDVSGRAGETFAWVEVSRGVAAGDIDNDGDTDLVISNNSGPPRLLINQVGQNELWLGLRLLGSQAPRDMLGAWVGLERQGARSLWRRVRTDGSYLSASDPRVLLGLGGSSHGESDRVVVRWPSGRQTVFHLAAKRYSILREGTKKGSG